MTEVKHFDERDAYILIKGIFLFSEELAIMHKDLSVIMREESNDFGEPSFYYYLAATHILSGNRVAMYIKIDKRAFTTNSVSPEKVKMLAKNVVVLFARQSQNEQVKYVQTLNKLLEK